MPRVPVRLSLAGRLPLSALRRRRGRRDAPAAAAVAVQGLRGAYVGHGRHGDAQDTHAAAAVVLGGLPRRHPPPGISAVQLQRQLGVSRHETAWMPLHKLRRAMVAPEREPLKREVEVDEFFLGGYEEGLAGGRARGKKTLCGVAVEVRGHGSGRVRLAVLADASSDSLSSFVRPRPRQRHSSTPTAGAATAAWQGSATSTDRATRVPRPRARSPTCHTPIARSRTSRRGCTAPTGMPHLSTCPPTERVRLPPQPTAQPARSVPDPARTQHRPRGEHLPRDHRRASRPPDR